MSHTPGPWHVPHLARADVMCDCGYVFGNDDRMGAVATVHWSGPNNEAVANAKLIAAAPDLLEGAILQSECGYPEPSHAYDEECVECWRWTHPDGRTWFELGGHDEPPPPHPVLAAAIAKAKEGSA